MRILFERNIANKYTDALAAEQWTTVTNCDDHLKSNALDKDIAEFARRNDWVVMTIDDDFFKFPNIGIMLLHQTENPNVGDVVDAVESIANAYSDHSKIKEPVPGRWAP